VSDSLTITEDVYTLTIEEDNLELVLTEESVEVLEVGAQGPAGPPGASGDKHYTQPFTGVASVSVTHNLGKYPAVTVIVGSPSPRGA
jgi:hypothetical protein